MFIWQDMDDTGSSYHVTVVKQWKEVTLKCLGHELSLWLELFRDEFIARSKVISWRVLSLTQHASPIKASQNDKKSGVFETFQVYVSFPA